MKLYIQSQKSKSFDCKEKWSELDLILGFYLEDKKDFKEFVNCYNSKKPSSYYVQFRGERVNVDTFIPVKSKEGLKVKKSKTFTEIYRNIMQALESDKKKRDDSVIYSFLKDLKGKNNLVARLLEVHIYFEYSNPAKAHATIKELLEIDFFDHVFTSDLSHISVNDQTEMIKALLVKLSGGKVSKNAIDALIFYIHFHSTHELRASLEKKFDIPQSITQVQRKYKTVLYGQELPFVWAPSLYENSSRKEYVRYVREFFKDRKVVNSSELLLFRNFPALKKERKGDLLNLFMRLREKKSPRSQSIYFTLLEDEMFYRFATSGTNQKIGLLISEKRKFLLSLLANSGLQEYALLSLLSIGDIDSSYIESHILHHD